MAGVERLTGQTAAVTGAARGIGRAIAERLAGEGAAVAVLDRDGDGAEATAGALRAQGGRAAAFTVDVADYGAVRAAFSAVGSALGPVDILVNNAGWDKPEPFLENDPETWERVIGINYKGVIHCMRAALEGMVARQRGKIISISSDAARVGSSGEAVYAGCKAAIIGLSKAVAREVARQGIAVNVVCPGPTDTPLLTEIMAGERGEKYIEAMRRQIPFGRLGQPTDIAAAVAFFASPDADFITGQVLSVSGGLTMAG